MNTVKLLAIFVLLLVLIALTTGTILAKGKGNCDANPGPGAVAAAIAAASPGDTICLNGVYPGEPTATISASRVTVMAGSGASPVLAGGFGPAFKLADGVHNVTIQDLEIHSRGGFRGGGVEAWNVSTSNTTIRGNYIHDNSYAGVLVGSNGSTSHSNWTVRNNRVNGNGFAGIELTNCNQCSIMSNELDMNGFAGVVVQARNTVPGGAPSEVNGVNVLGTILMAPALLASTLSP